jgi:predicted unusual protein kinase regulating ubiquinone biosynthesis (AarF/ABC1/UbiB family)
MKAPCLLHQALLVQLEIVSAPYLRSCVSGAGKAKPQLVLLDHGLYRSLDKEVRSNYAALWKVRGVR